jgi:glycosyltransferase involved in cell wall biosynthesis
MFFKKRDNRPFTMVSVGRLDRQKGFKYLLDALALLKAKIPSVRCVIAGDGAERGSLERQIRYSGLADIVTLPGHVEDIPGLLKQADIFILPSLWEGLPHALIEAAASATPIIASDVGGNREALDDGHHGILIRPESPEAIVDAVLWIYNNMEASRMMALRAQEYAFRKFSFETMVSMVERVYIDVLAG